MTDALLASLQSWEEGGREKLCVQFTELQSLSLSSPSLSHPQAQSFNALLFALIDFVVPSHPHYNERHSQHVLVLIVSCLDTASRSDGESYHSPAQEVLASALWVAWARLHAASDKQAIATFTIHLLSDPVSGSSVFPLRLLKELLQDDFIETVGSWNKAQLAAVTTRIRTSEFYRQHKFNLFHEDNEGFTKLIDLLYSSFAASPSLPCGLLHSRINALIGYFDLDPNRVIDVLVSVYADCHRDDSIDDFIALICNYPQPHCEQIVGFKLTHTGTNTDNDTDSDRLIGLVAVLVKRKVLSLESLWSHLQPSDESLIQSHLDWTKRETDRASKIGLASLTNTDATNDSDSAMKPVSLDVSSSQALNKNDASIIISEPINTIQPSVILTQSPPLPSHSQSRSQKSQLLASLIDCDAWEEARLLMRYLSAVDCLGHSVVAQALCRALERAIEPYYQSLTATHMKYQQFSVFADPNTSHGSGSDGGSVIQTSQWLSLPSHLFELTELLTHNLGINVVVFTKLCRVFSHISSLTVTNTGTNADSDSGSVTLPTNMETIVANCLLPSYSFLPSSIAHANTLWSVLSPLPYTVRYRLYGHWYKLFQSQSSLPLTVLNKHLVSQTKYYRKRIAAAKVKECSRLLVKFSLSMPMIVFDLLLQQIQQFDNMIVPVCESLRYLPMIGFDCLTFTIIHSIVNNTSGKLKSDGMNESHWFQSLSSMIGHLYKRVPDVDFSPLVQTVVNALKQGDTVMALIAKELIAAMTGIEVYEEMSDAIIEGKYSSRTVARETANVRGLVMGPLSLKMRERSYRSLIDVLTKTGSVLPLYVLLMTSRDWLIYESDYDEPRLIGELYDKTDEVSLQLIEMLDYYYTSDADYARWFPSLFDLVHKHSLAIPEAFHAIRRVVHLPRIQGNDIYRQEMDESSGGNANVSELLKKAASQYQPLKHTLSLLLPPTIRSVIPIDLYALFWRLSLYHLHVPTNSYDTTIKRLRTNIQTIDRQEGEWKDSAEMARKREKERLAKLITRIEEEKGKHSNDRAAVLAMLRREKDSWLVHTNKDFFPLFASECLLPRVLVSPIDALYTAHFLQTIVGIGTPRFLIALMWDALIATVSPMIASCTGAEASRYGRFLALVLQHMEDSILDARRFTDTSSKLPAFACKVTEPNGARFTHTQMRLVYARWQRKLLQVFSRAFTSDDKHLIGNALLVAVKIGQQFPKFSSAGAEMERQLEAVIANEGKEGTSLKVLATRAHALLQAQKKNWMTDEKVAVSGSVTAETKPAPQPQPPQAVKRGFSPTPARSSPTPQPQPQQLPQARDTRGRRGDPQHDVDSRRPVKLGRSTSPNNHLAVSGTPTKLSAAAPEFFPPSAQRVNGAHAQPLKQEQYEGPPPQRGREVREIKMDPRHADTRERGPPPRNQPPLMPPGEPLPPPHLQQRQQSRGRADDRDDRFQPGAKRKREDEEFARSAQSPPPIPTEVRYQPPPYQGQGPKRQRGPRDEPPFDSRGPPPPRDSLDLPLIALPQHRGDRRGGGSGGGGGGGQWAPGPGEGYDRPVDDRPMHPGGRRGGRHGPRR